MRNSEASVSVMTFFYEAERPAYRALLALQRIERERGLKAVGVLDAAVMKGAAGRGKLTIDRTIEFREGGNGPTSVIFPTAILSLGSVGRSAGAAKAHFADLGFSTNLLQEIGENLPPDGAALVVIVEETWVSQLGEAVRGYADRARYTVAPDASLTFEVRRNDEG